MEGCILMTFNTTEQITFFRHAIEHVSVGIHAIDLHGNSVIYNNKMKEIEGYELPDDNNRSLLDLFHLKQQEGSLFQVLQSGNPQNNSKQTHWNKEGHEITTLNDTFPLYEQGKLIGAIQFARDITSLEKLVYQPLRRYDELLTFEIITAVSVEMKEIIELAKKTAYTETPVLLIGESGTGKDMIAEGIHHYLSPKKAHFMTIFSRREDGMMLSKVHNALKSEQAHTFFFERIEFLSLDVQAELLQLLYSLPRKQHMVIGSTGSDPIELIANGSLKKELYYFFAAFSITIPPLRQRKMDIEPFVLDYFERHRERFGSQITHINDDVLTTFLQYDWPGNLKELELLLDEIAAIITHEQTLTHDLLPLHFLFKTQQDKINNPAIFMAARTKKELLPLDDYMHQAEKFYIQNVMQMYNGNVTKAAAALQMSRQNLQYRLRKIKKDD